MAVIGREEESARILEGASRLPGGYYVKDGAEGCELLRYDAATSSVVRCMSCRSPGEAFEGYVKAFAQELVLGMPELEGSRAEEALGIMEMLVRDAANHRKGGGDDGKREDGDVLQVRREEVQP